MKKEVIISIGEEIHEFIEDKPKVDNCFKCSLKQICDDRAENALICKIFNEENGHFESKVKKENE